MLSNLAPKGAPKALLLAALMGGLLPGCATLNETIQSLMGDVMPAAAGKSAVPEGFPEGNRAYTTAEQKAIDAGWNVLNRDAVREKGICLAAADSSPMREYWKISDCHQNDNGSLSWLRGDPAGYLETFLFETCDNEILACDFVAQSIAGAPLAEERKLFQGLLLMQDPDLLAAVGADGEYNLNFAGSFFADRGFYFFNGIEGLGVLGHAEDNFYLDALVDEPWKADLLGRDLRNKVARSFWWLANTESADMLMNLMEKEHATRYQNREFRPMILNTLAAWDSDAAVSFCESNLRDLGDTDRGACMFYLFERGQRGKAVEMVRYAEESGELGLMTIGLFATPEGKKYLKDKVNNDGYTEELVALALSGDNSGFKKLQKQLKDPAWHDRRMARALRYFAHSDKAGWAIGALKNIGKTLKKDGNDHQYAATLAIRAQLGDQSVIDPLVSLLGGPDEAVRESIVENIGGEFSVVNASVPLTEIVANQKLLDALQKAIEMESDDGNRERAAIAALNIRAALRLQK